MNVTNDQRRGLYEFLLGRCNNEVLQSGCTKAATARFEVATQTINQSQLQAEVCLQMYRRQM